MVLGGFAPADADRWTTGSRLGCLRMRRTAACILCSLSLFTVLAVLTVPRSLFTPFVSFLLPNETGHAYGTGMGDPFPAGRRTLLGKSDELLARPSTTRNGTQLREERRLPRALIIGVKKGGTRALLEFLRMHPDVRAARREIHFFDRFYDRGLDWYRSQMPPSLSDQLTMEKTPGYFITREAPARIHAMSPDTKLLVVVRDPVTRAISDYTQLASKQAAKNVRVQSFEDMVFANASSGLLDTNWIILRIGVYVKFLRQWLQYFRLGQMHFVSGERLVQDPVSELDLVQAFLGLDNRVGPDHFYYNETKGFPCIRRADGGTGLAPHCLGESKGRTHPRIRKEAIQRLADFYRPFNQRFCQMVGRDFGWS